MKTIAYGNEAAGLQIWHDEEDPSTIFQNWAERHTVALDLPGFRLTEKATALMADAARQMLSDLIKATGGVAYGDIEIVIEGTGPDGAGGRMTATSMYWPLVAGSEAEQMMRGMLKTESVKGAQPIREVDWPAPRQSVGFEERWPEPDPTNRIPGGYHPIQQGRPVKDVPQA